MYSNNTNLQKFSKSNYQASLTGDNGYSDVSLSHKANKKALKLARKQSRINKQQAYQL